MIPLNNEPLVLPFTAQRDAVFAGEGFGFNLPEDVSFNDFDEIILFSQAHQVPTYFSLYSLPFEIARICYS